MFHVEHTVTRPIAEAGPFWVSAGDKKLCLHLFQQGQERAAGVYVELCWQVIDENDGSDRMVFAQ
jgi:hypothetical protein